MTRVELALIIRGKGRAILRLGGLGVGRGWRIGDPMSTSPGMSFRDSGWEITSPLPLTAPLEEHLQSVLDAIEPIWKFVLAASKVGETELSVALYVTRGHERAGTQITREQAAKLAELDSSLDFDIYQYVPERD